MFHKELTLKQSNSETQYKMIMDIKDNDNVLQILLSNKQNPMTEN